MTDDERLDDVANHAGINADSFEEIRNCISDDILSKYDVYSYRHAASILKNSFSSELNEIEEALRAFNITLDEIAKPGGSESDMPKKISNSLRPKKWFETKIQGDLIVRVHEHSEEILSTGKIKKHTLPERDPVTLKNYIDGHKIDYVKGRVALDMEWNSKDQTFDRDLYAFRMFHECGIISLAVILTRSTDLNEIFNELPLKKKDGSIDRNDDGSQKLCKQKYGASTTWMGKLLYRLNAGRHGGCPVLVLGIRREAISDLNELRMTQGENE
ncbi:MAG TPA: BglII/BstYI family type II restriction endonuclease [Clostridiales bacterium]|nr:BglII/BstYI family type II restriction endonuclease [Clostridiales bacterium]